MRSIVDFSRSNWNRAVTKREMWVEVGTMTLPPKCPHCYKSLQLKMLAILVNKPFFRREVGPRDEFLRRPASKVSGADGLIYESGIHRLGEEFDKLQNS